MRRLLHAPLCTSSRAFRDLDRTICAHYIDCLRHSRVLARADCAAKRPMTFEDMMKMKRLGETAVSPDGKWLAYSVTTVNLEQNTKTPELWLQAIAGWRAAPKLAVAQPGDSGMQFAPDGKRILFLSGREGGAAGVAGGF